MDMVHDLIHAFETKDSMLLDVTLKCGDSSFKANKFMLTSSSSVFKAMFESNMMESQTNEVKIVDFQPEVVEAMLEYIHTGWSNNLFTFPQEMLAAAHRYELEHLKVSCLDFLVNSLDVENCVDLLILSETYNADYLKEMALNYAAKNMTSISNDLKKELARFPSLTVDMFERLANMNDRMRMIT